MARTRSVAIVESLEELDQLRSYYLGKPEATRILFLRFLKEERTRTITQAAVRTGISARRGRYWWDAYRVGGLQKLLDRRVWRKSELAEATSDTASPRNANVKANVHDSLPWIGFLSSVAMNSSEFSDANLWMKGFRESLMILLNEIDFIVVNIRHGIDVLNPGKGKVHVQRKVSNEEALLAQEVSSSDEGDKVWETLIQQGKRSGFPFEKYHYPPTGFDYFIEAGKRSRRGEDEDDSYIGSLLLFREAQKEPVSQDTVDLVERLRPFIVFSMTDFVVRSSLASGPAGNIEGMVDKVAGDASLTPQETRVLLLGFLGHTYQEIGSQLHVSVHTVQSHIRAIYRKTGASKLGEIYARFFTASNFPDSEPLE